MMPFLFPVVIDVIACVFALSFYRLIAVDTWMQRLTVPAVDAFIADLKDAVQEAKLAPSGKGTMVALYGTFPSSP